MPLVGEYVVLHLDPARAAEDFATYAAEVEADRTAHAAVSATADANGSPANSGTNPGTVVIGAPVCWIELTIAVQVASAALAE